MPTLLALALLFPLSQAPSAPRNVAILVYEGVELLDFAGPGEVFAAAHGHDGHAFRVVTVAREKGPLVSQGFVRIEPTYALADCPPLAVLVLPGGHVPDDDPALVAWVRERARTAECVMSVCNGAFLLAQAGLLDGLEATTHHSALEALTLGFPRTKVFTNRRFVDSGKVMTCAGVSAGIDGALQLVARLVDEPTARATARYMEYDWRPEELAALHAEPGLLVPENPLRRVGRLAREQGPAAGRAALAALTPAPGEDELCRAAQRIAARQPADARALLALILELHSASARPHELLSDLCEADGQREEAVRHAREALARLDDGRDTSTPENAALLRNSAASRLARLGAGDAAALRWVCEPCHGPCDERRYVSPGVCPACRMRLVEAATAR